MSRDIETIARPAKPNEPAMPKGAIWYQTTLSPEFVTLLLANDPDIERVVLDDLKAAVRLVVKRG